MHFMNSLASWDRHLPDADLVVTVSGEQGLSVSGPGQRQALWWFGLWVVGGNSWTQFFDHLLACQIPNLDGWSISDTQPVTVWREAQSVDDIVVIQSVQVLAVIQIPQQSFAVLSSWSAQGAIGRDGNGVQVSVVSVMVQLEFAVGQVPDLDGAIPTGWHDDWVDLVWRESDARHPVGVTIFLDGVFAFGQSVPQLDGLVAGSRDDLTVVSGESNGENVLKEERYLRYWNSLKWGKQKQPVKKFNGTLPIGDPSVCCECSSWFRITLMDLNHVFCLA